MPATVAPPRFIEPQLSKIAEKAPAGDGWAHEIKFDGYRLAARIVGKKARLLTRRGADWTGRYPSIAAALEKLPAKSAYLDGELCAMTPDGTASFNALHGKRGARLAYFASEEPHTERKLGLLAITCPVQAVPGRGELQTSARASPRQSQGLVVAPCGKWELPAPPGERFVGGLQTVPA
jgi:ATP dependent DNA ligase domain